MYNIGDTSFMNVVLQCLLISPQLFELVSKNIKDRNIQKEDEHKYQITQAFVNLFSGWTLKAISKEYLNNLKELISTINPQFQDDRQLDSHEFFWAVLEGLSQELSSYKFNQKKSPSVSPDSSLKEQSDAYWEYYTKWEDNWITDLFGGQLVNLIYCDACNQFLYDFYDVTNISVEIPKLKSKEYRPKYGNVDIEDWIKETVKQVTIDLNFITQGLSNLI